MTSWAGSTKAAMSTILVLGKFNAFSWLQIKVGGLSRLLVLTAYQRANSADGQASFTKINDINPNYYCDPRGIHFIDMKADGLDDFVCITANGDAYLSVNKRNGNRAAGKAPTFQLVGKIKSNEGVVRDHVVMADIDGDGRGKWTFSKSCLRYTNNK